MSSKHPEPRRLRWSVPAADTSTNQWLDAQENISRSLQVLIRETIQRDGYVDIVNRPVEQLPRRGRPPKESRQGDDGGETGDAGEDQHSPGPQDHQGQQDAPDRQPQPVRQDTPAAAGTGGLAETSAPASSPAPVGTGQHDMDDIFGHGG